MVCADKNVWDGVAVPDLLDGLHGFTVNHGNRKHLHYYLFS